MLLKEDTEWSKFEPHHGLMVGDRVQVLRAWRIWDSGTVAAISHLELSFESENRGKERSFMWDADVGKWKVMHVDMEGRGCIKADSPGYSIRLLPHRR